LTVIVGDTEGDMSVKPEAEGVKNTGANRINSVAEGDGEVMSKFGNGRNGPGLEGNHQTNRNLSVNNAKFYPKDVALQSSVANAFKAYEEFLRQLSRGNPPSQAGDSGIIANHKPICDTGKAGFFTYGIK
jgi:hypothetical protein